MKHIKKYNESVKKELDKSFFEMVFIDLIEDKVVLDIKENYNFFKNHFDDGRKGTNSGIIILIKSLPESRYIDNYINSIEIYKKNMLHIENSIQKIKSEFDGIDYYLVNKSNNTSNRWEAMKKSDILLYFWYPKI